VSDAVGKKIDVTDHDQHKITGATEK